MPTQRSLVSTGTRWEEIVGFSRAIRVDNLVEVAGTVAADDRGQVVGLGDVYQQTRFIISKIEKALNAVGASLQDVVRTRIYVTDIELWQEVGHAHGETFHSIRPVTSMVEVSSLISPEYQVEIEATAIVED